MTDATRDEADINFTELRETLAARFSEDDLRNLAFDLNIDYESLPGAGKAGKGREIIAYCRQHNRVLELLTVCRRLRSDVPLPKFPQEARPEPTTPATTTQPKAVHQLRSPVADFIGRATEIKDLVQVLSTAVSDTIGAIAIIRGLGGLGKTQLANMVAHQLRDTFPDGQIFLELQGVNENAISPERVVQRVIQIFEPHAQVAETLGDLQTLYRSILDGKRVLIVADNAKDEAQVRALEPPPGCALLVTSRQRFSLPGATILDLEALPKVEAEALLLKLCPRIKAAAGRLAKLCGQLPLALRVSASLLENDATQNIARYLEALEKERLRYLSDPEAPDDPTVSVSASLNLSYKALNDARQRILCQISVFPASFDLKAAKAVISLQGVKAGAGDERERRAALEATGQTTPVKLKGRAVLPREDESLGMLYRRSLVEYDTATERYNLHDLVRVFAADRLETTDEQIRYVRHYLAIAQEAHDLYSQGNEYIFQGLRLFDNERTHIDKSLIWLLQQPNKPSIDELIISFCKAMFTIGIFRYNRQIDRISLFEKAYLAAKRLKYKFEQAYFLNTLGYDYRELGETQRGMELHKQAFDIYQETNNDDGEISVLNNLGMDYSVLGDFRRALEYYKQVLEKIGNGDYRHHKGIVTNNLGLAYVALGNASQAIKSFNESLRMDRDDGDQDDEGTSLGNLGRAYIDLGETAKAVALCEQSLAIKRQIGNRWHEGYALHFLGLAYAAAGELQHAHNLQQEALGIAKESGSRRVESNILNALGEISILQSDQEIAIDYLNKSLSIARQIEDRNGETLALWNLGRVYERQGDFARAAELMQMRVDYEREIGHLKVEEHAAQLAQIQVQLEAGSAEAGAE